MLTEAKRWYVDGTFKLCRPPFSQLFSINAFVRQGDYAKQVPLLFVLKQKKARLQKGVEEGKRAYFSNHLYVLFK